jgi:Zn-dependent peptidase ImmA (M78 family)
MTGMQAFGDPNRFEISARWIQDHEDRDRLPKAYGWSMGEFCIKVGGVTLTEHRIHGKPKDAIQWYLGPLVSWLLSQWKWLMHEEAYTWSTLSGDSAAFTVEADLERYMASEYPKDRDVYKEIRAWWMRHTLRSADPSALYPPIVIRRVEDSIEVSWLDKQPEFAPEGFELNLNPGAALFPVEEVAKPLWDFLRWTIESATPVTEVDLSQVEALRALFESAQQFQFTELEAVHVTAEIFQVIMEEARNNRWVANRKMSKKVPVVTELDMPVLMFGGLSVNIGANDVRELFNILVQKRRGKESGRLTKLVSSPSIYEYLQPYVHGYELAYQIREALEINLYTAFIDIEKLLDSLGISILDTALETNSIRGVAIAGENFLPTIVVNKNHKFNGSTRGRRFTLAHEFCHILFDRSRAKRLSHISGPWTSGRVEKRANAFAALFLATPHALERTLSTKVSLDAGTIKRLASKFEIGTGALLEHLHNLDLISGDDFQAISSVRYH